MQRNILLLCLLILNCLSLTSQTDSKASAWYTYKHPDEAGFNAVKLTEVKETFLEQGGTAMLVIRKGHVVLSVGPTTRCFRQTSVRKSYLHALYGIYKERGAINLESTLDELGIDDREKLSTKEKQATVQQLLESRSGVYHPAAYAPKSMEKRLPPRGSVGPGERWFYNNWDFNVLGTIFRETTGEDIFSAFHREIAEPLGMEDWDIRKTKYLYEEHKSEHPAYLFRMSARDMARFGQMYLQQGYFGGRQIIDTTWVHKGFEVHSKNGIDSLGTHWDNYGMLWWISNQITEQPVYYASGSGVQRISVLPESDLVLVHVVDNYQSLPVPEEKVDHLTHLLLDAIEGPVKNHPELDIYQAPSVEIRDTSVSLEYLSHYQGTVQHPRLGTFEFLMINDQLVLRAGIGDFKLIPSAKDLFINADMQIPIRFYWGNSDLKGMLIPDLNSDGVIRHFKVYF